MPQAIFPAIYNPGVVMNTVNLLGVDVNAGQWSRELLLLQRLGMQI